MLIYSTLNNIESQADQDRNEPTESDDGSQVNHGVVLDVKPGTSAKVQHEDENSKTGDEELLIQSRRFLRVRRRAWRMMRFWRMLKANW